MGRPSKWNSKTTGIRVPEHTVPQLMALARQLDVEPEPDQGFVQNSQPLLLTVEEKGESTRYLLPAQTLTQAQSDQADALIDQVLAELPIKGRDAIALFLAELAPRCLTPL